jgi:cytochrome c oxidase cbb3-type subunit III
MYGLWLGLAVVGSACGRASQAATPADGERLFAAVCARCHGSEGTGGVALAGGPAPRNLQDPTFQRARTDADIRHVITSGKGVAMPAFRAAFQPHEIDALVAYVRSLDSRRRQ